MMRNVELTAHAGADGTIENTIVFVRYALTTEADTLEIDVRKNRETGQLQIGHDDLKEDAADLKEVFDLLKAHPCMKINCDLKEPGMEKAVLGLADKCQVRDRLILSGTVDPFQIEDTEFRKDRVFWNIEEQIPDLYKKCLEDKDYRLVAAEMMCDKMEQAGVDTMNVYFMLADIKFVEAVQKRKKKISVWTVNDMETVKGLLSLGVRNITTGRIYSAVQNSKIVGQREVKNAPILHEEFWWTPADSGSDVKLHFRVPKEVDALEIRFHYTPGEESCDEYCREPVEKAIKTYYGDHDPSVEPMTAQKFYPIKNLVTVSASQNGEYVGNAHRWDTNQKLIFTTDHASPGFSPRKTMDGEWETQLHIHCIISPRCRGVVDVIGHSYENTGEMLCSDAHQMQACKAVTVTAEHASAVEGALHWYPVELHTHTQHSDGDYSVPSMVKRVEELGFSGIALTDHNSKAGLSELLRETSRSGLVPIRGLEWTTYFGHMLVLGENGYTDWRGVGPKDMDKAIASIHKNNGIVGVAHPKSIADPIKTGYRWLFEIADWSQVDFLEVWSRNDAPLKLQTEGAFQMWDELLNRGYHITGTSGRDMHRQDHNAYAHTFVGSRDELSEEQVFYAIRHGRICAAMGPLLTVEGSVKGKEAECGDTVPSGSMEIHWNVTCDKLRNDYDQDKIIPKRIRLIQNGRQIASTDIPSWDCDPEKVLKGSFTIQTEEGWVRAEMTGDYFGKENVRIAFANPFYIKD